jgi:PAS domain-containing protein
MRGEHDPRPAAAQPAMTNERRQKSLVLILAREFASNLAMPIYIADADETLVYFNEPAEKIAGRSFAETGEIPMRHWTRMLVPRDVDGAALEREETPGGIAFAERRPAHARMRITGLDGREREIATTALPLLGPDDEFHGIMVIFWEQE